MHRQFDAPGVAGSGVLFFRLRVLKDRTLSYRINQAPTLSHELRRGDPRSFHEIYPLSTLKPDSNQLTMVVSNGRVVVSDVIFLYQTTT